MGHLFFLRTRTRMEAYWLYRYYFLNLSVNKTVRIFKSMEEQEQYHQQIMLQSTIAERFRKLCQMQQLTKLLHPATDHSRKILIRRWTS
jgi:hypothetical protein